MRKLTVDLLALEEAFSDLGEDASHWLDLETGAVVRVDFEMQEMLETAHERLEEATVAGEELELADALTEVGAPDWLRDAVLQWHELTAHPDRLLAIPPADGDSDYEDMIAFIERLDEPRFRDRLSLAVRASGPFRRFRDIVGSDTDVRERWLAFRSVRLRERVADWLEHQQIDAFATAGR